LIYTKQKKISEGEGSTDPIMIQGRITYSLDGKNSAQLKEAIQMAKKASKEIYNIQMKALKNVGKEITNE
jgi:hypothetical protein